MKILIVLIRWKGGVGRVVENVKRELELKGHEVEVISREDDLKCFSAIKSFFKLRKLVKEKDYDILYSQDWSCALPNMLKKHHYVCFHGRETKTRLLHLLIGKLKGNKLTVVGDTLKKEFPKSTLVYNGVDRTLFKKIDDIKRIKNSIGFANWETDEYSYKEIKEAADNLGMNFIDTNLKLNKKEMVKFYNGIEVFISLPKPFAGFNISWIEAMACGVPKIIGNYNGIGRSLDINHVEDFKSISDAIKYGKCQINYEINKKYDWKIHTEKLIELFSKHNEKIKKLK